MPDHEFINAPARQCSVRRTGFGERFVRYRGKDYLLMGLYLVPQPGERPELFFVLRSIDGGGPARTPLLSSRHRVRLRSIMGLRLFPQGVLMAALIALLALLGNGPKSPEGATRQPTLAAPDHSRRAGDFRSALAAASLEPILWLLLRLGVQPPLKDPNPLRGC